MTIEQHNGVHVLRDDLLPGGTKSIILPKILDPSKDYYVYASPVYGGMQIALAAYCRSIGKQAVIFCAKRKQPHPNSLRAKASGAIIYQVPYGYLSNCQSKARDFVARNNAQLIEFGGNYPAAIQTIACRMRQLIHQMGSEPDEVYCAAGSGTLLRGILAGTTKAKVTAVQIGAQLTVERNHRLVIVRYNIPFEKECKLKAPFPSCPNYDLKAWDVCMRYKSRGKVLFWNVL